MTCKHVETFRLVPPSGLERRSATATAATCRARWFNPPLGSAARIKIHVIEGSIEDFCPNDFSTGPPVSYLQQRAAIVHAADPGCQVKHFGVDSIIASAGSPVFVTDYPEAVRIVFVNDNTTNTPCPSGQGTIAGPGDYGELHVPYVIHVDGTWRYANNTGGYYGECSNLVSSSSDNSCHRLLKSAYQLSLDCALEQQLEHVALPLLSTGSYRGQTMSLSWVVTVCVEAIQDLVVRQHLWQQEQQQQERLQPISLEHIYICGQTSEEAQAVDEVCHELGFIEDSDDVGDERFN